MDRLAYQQWPDPFQDGPPIPPRAPMLGQTTGVQSSPEVSTGEGVGAGVLVQDPNQSRATSWGQCPSFSRGISSSR